MNERHLDAYIIPSEDQHMSEYVPECYQRRKWISGFTGSAGTGCCVPPPSRLALVTKEEALLWTDSRYFLQAEMELPSYWKLMKAGTKDCPKIFASFRFAS